MRRIDLLGWWPDHLQQVFVAIGTAMKGGRLQPETLLSIPKEFGGILPDHLVTIRHVSRRELGRRSGHYILTIDGSRFGGQWMFLSGELEQLASSAIRDAPKRRGQCESA